MATPLPPPKNAEILNGWSLIKVFNGIKSQMEDSVRRTLIAYETQLHQIFQPHGSVHVKLRCTMLSLSTAAYDPIFWLHHGFIDKIWAERQNKPGLPKMTNTELKDTILEPFGGK